MQSSLTEISGGDALLNGGFLDIQGGKKSRRRSHSRRRMMMGGEESLEGGSTEQALEGGKKRRSRRRRMMMGGEDSLLLGGEEEGKRGRGRPRLSPSTKSRLKMQRLNALQKTLGYHQFYEMGQNVIDKCPKGSYRSYRDRSGNLTAVPTCVSKTERLAMTGRSRANNSPMPGPYKSEAFKTKFGVSCRKGYTRQADGRCYASCTKGQSFKRYLGKCTNKLGSKGRPGAKQIKEAKKAKSKAKSKSLARHPSRRVTTKQKSKSVGPVRKSARLEKQYPRRSARLSKM